MDLPLKVLCELGGWKEAQTVLRCYQQADSGQLRKALDSRPTGSRLIRANWRESNGGNPLAELRKMNDHNDI